jgi:hypothetical protein
LPRAGLSRYARALYQSLVCLRMKGIAFAAAHLNDALGVSCHD